jgi:hypothetical protein
MEVSGQLHDPAALPQGKSHWYPLDRKLGESQNRSGRGGEEKNSQSLPGLELPIIQPVALRYTIEKVICFKGKFQIIRKRVLSNTTIF